MKNKAGTILKSLSVLIAFSLTFYAYCGCKAKNSQSEQKPKCCHSSKSEKPSSQNCPANGDCCLKKIPLAVPFNGQTSTSNNFFITVNPECSLSTELNFNLIAEGYSIGPPFLWQNDKQSILCIFII